LAAGELGSCAFVVIGLVCASDFGDSGQVSRREVGLGSVVCPCFVC